MQISLNYFRNKFLILIESMVCQGISVFDHVLLSKIHQLADWSGPHSMEGHYCVLCSERFGWAQPIKLSVLIGSPLFLSFQRWRHKNWPIRTGALSYSRIKLREFSVLHSEEPFRVGFVYVGSVDEVNRPISNFTRSGLNNEVIGSEHSWSILKRDTDENSKALKHWWRASHESCSKFKRCLGTIIPNLMKIFWFRKDESVLWLNS